MADQERPDLFPTNFGGKAINAVTGVYYGFDQGDAQENGLFKVNYTIGDLDAKGFELPPGYVYTDAPLRFLFDSPKQYYNFWEVPVEDRNVGLIQKWKTRKSGLDN